MRDGGPPVPAIVLIVEDDPRIADFMQRGLRASGFSVEWVMTGNDALQRVLAGGVAVQILDLGLPDMDGLDLLGQLSERGASVPTIIVTARSDPRYREEAFALGVRTYITKPFPWQDLVAAVRAEAATGTQP